MNWRKGMFRVWVAVSVLWVIGVGVVAWSTYPEINTYKVHYISSEGKLVSAYDFDDHIEESVAKGVVQKVRLPSGLVTLLPKGITKTEALPRVKELERALQTDLSKRRSEFIRDNWFSYVGSAASVPLILLGLGSLIGWALSGFRK